MYNNVIKTFETAYNKLNKEQQEAVNTLYGPVMVVAGPGTGKTQILAMRIANMLLSDAQIAPQNILCMTYTEEGKKNMRDRLYHLIGAQTASLIQVHTYHSFCNDVILQNPAFFEKSDLELVSQLEELEIVKEILDTIQKGHLFYSPKNPYKETQYLLNLFKKMKQENWSALWLTQKINEEIEDISNNPANLSTRGNTTGMIKSDFLKKINSLEKTLAGIAFFDQYNEKLLEKNRYDYNDMIQWVLSALEKNESLLYQYQEQNQYILVDEFQDTNGSQMHLLELLNNYDDAPNFFIVGDDDQSIFRFQGASVENMIRFENKYKKHGLKQICLKTNYRSTQGILNKADELISNAEVRLSKNNPSLTKKLIAYNTLEHKLDSYPCLYEFTTQRHEHIYIAQKIKQLIDDGVNPAQIAVLYLKNDMCKALSEYLEKLDIPFFMKRKQNLLNDAFGKQLINLLRYIAMERQVPGSGDEMLYEILHYRFFNLTAHQCAHTLIQKNDYVTKNKEYNLSFRGYLSKGADVQSPSLFEQHSPFTVMDILNKLITDSFNDNLLHFIDKIIQQCSITEYILKQNNKYELLETLTVWFDFIKDTCARDQDMDIVKFISLLNTIIDNNLEIPLHKIYGNEHAVKLYTIHSSKGREYDYVFVPALTSSVWEKSSSGKNKISLPDNINESAPNKKDNEETRRLLYVACTRAKKELYLSYYIHNTDGKEQEKSKFLYEMFTNEENEIAIEIDQETLLYFETVQSKKDELVKVAELEKEFVTRKLENFTMNVTALNHYLACPLSFYFNNIICLPSSLNENMSFGSVMHAVLEMYFKAMVANNNQFGTLEEMQMLIIPQMLKRKQFFSKEGYAKKMQYAKEIVQYLYEQKMPHWHKIVSLEYKLNVVWNDIPLKGFIDKVEYYNNEIEVIDYKTGDILSDFTKPKLKSKNKDKNEIGGDYWRQAMFYKILFDNDPKNKYQVRAAKYDFIEPPKINAKEVETTYYFTFSDEEINQVKEQIKDTWQKIQAHDFYTGCGKKDCVHCNYAKEIIAG